MGHDGRLAISRRPIFDSSLLPWPRLSPRPLPGCPSCASGKCIRGAPLDGLYPTHRLTVAISNHFIRPICFYTIIVVFITTALYVYDGNIYVMCYNFMSLKRQECTGHYKDTRAVLAAAAKFRILYSELLLNIFRNAA